MSRASQRNPHLTTICSLPLLAATIGVAITVGASPVHAQILEGYLREGGSGEPIAGGTVGLFTPRGFTIDIGITDHEGYFEMSSPEAGTFFLTADADGFVDLTHGHFELLEGQATSFDVFLRPLPVELDGVAVEVERVPLALRVREMRLGMVGFRKRAQAGLGHFVTPEDLDRMQATQASRALRMIPRVDVLPGFGNPISMECGEFAAFIDGVAIWSGEGWEMDAFVQIEDVSAIEVYTSLAQLPIEFKKGGNCGAVVVWTKG